MQLRKLEVTGVRNLNQVTLAGLSPINIFFGSNGSGKTSVLESIHLLSLAKSFRSHKVKPVIHHDSDQLVVFGELLTADNIASPMGIQRSKKEPGLIKVDGKALRSVAELAEYMPLQVINSATFLLLEGSPSVRRQFIDWGVFHVEHQFHSVWKATQRCLKQRNSLLRHGKIADEQLSLWSRELAKNGQQLDQYRQQYFEQLAPVFHKLLSQLMEVDGLTISYYRGWDKDKSLEDVLQENLTRELEQGRTLSSPHRADLRIRLNGSNAAESLSRGQQKLVVCALRVAQGYLLAKLTGRTCIYLIDDLPAELDKLHRKALCRLLEDLNSQVFVTCVDHKDLSDCWSDKNNINVFHVEHGCISQESRLSA